LRTDATSTVNSGYVAVDNAAAGGTFETGTGRQYNGTRTLFGPGFNTTQTGAFDASSNLATGLITDGIAGTNTLLGTTSTNGIVNAGNIATTTLNVSGTTTTNGIVNTGNIATTSLSTTGNATVGGTLAVSGATTTNGIDNSNQKITGVAPGTVSSSSTDAVNGSQLYQVSSAQATANANQIAINNNQATINANQANINAAQSVTNQQMQNQAANNRKISSGGIASATAAASIPALERGQKFGMGIGVGNYDGQSALAVGVAARVSEQLQLKFTVGTGGGGKTTVGAGGMYAW
jgi:autotransporter adhesin